MNTISLTYINNIEIMIVDLNGISVTSFYKPPGEQSSFDHPHITSGHQPQVIIGYFNSDSSQWGYATTNTGGEIVEGWAETHTLNIILDPKLPSSVSSGRWRRGYTPDLIFVTNRNPRCCNNIVMDPIPRSQHRPIVVQVHAAITIQSVLSTSFLVDVTNWEVCAQDGPLWRSIIHTGARTAEITRIAEAPKTRAARKEILYSTTRTSAGPTYPCPECGRVLPGIIGLISHLSTHSVNQT